MEVIINDLSLSGQFKNVEEFTSNLLDDIVPIFKMCEKYNISITKKSDIYNKNVTPSYKLSDLLLLRGDPVISRLKSFLAKLMSDEPFWDTQSKIEASSIYENEIISDRINCIYEAYERNASLISFLNSTFLVNQILISKDGTKYNIQNFSKTNAYIKYLHSIKIINDCMYLLEECPKIIFFEDKVKLFLECSGLNEEDRKTIVEDIITFYENYENKIGPGRFSKPLRDGCFEFRTTLRSSREVRILYFYTRGKILFVNAFIKQTEVTPKKKIDYAILCKDNYESAL